MNGFVVAAYLVILASLAAYALYLGARQRTLERAFEIAGVVDRPDRRLVGHGGRRDQVAAADFDPVEPARRRRKVEQAFDHDDRLGPAGAAIGAQRGGVGEHHLDAEIHGRDGVDA